jgi:hypothetical protein
MHTDRCDSNSGQECQAQGSRIESIIQEFIYTDTTNVEHKIYDYTRNNWRHQNINRRFKEKSGSHNRKIFNRFTTNTAILGT